MIRYFEYAVSEGEGTLLSHQVFTLLGTQAVDFTLWSACSQFILDSITIERYQEFITIHGSEVAV